ncbi:GAK system CofD-like protein [Cobetia marina]|uniref:GAK system CofD-like protein n=1 Tax=Cobetia marina TaxID=28258 RepID=A0ABU9G9U2_COBMA
MAEVRVSRTARVPDPLRVRRYHKAPEVGPRVLFFSGGTALTGISRTLTRYTHHSIHLVTPFDSGGSSAKLRDAFSMPAIGDLRSRLMALADDSVLGHPEIYRLFTHRLPAEARPEMLQATLRELAAGRHPLSMAVAEPMRTLICHQLGFLIEAMPAGFDLRGASIGNLIIAGGYLNHHEQLDQIIFLFSKLVHVRGTVRAIINADCHLAVTLEDGRRIIGQHQITGKEVAPLESPIARIQLVEASAKASPKASAKDNTTDSTTERDTHNDGGAIVPVRPALHLNNRQLIDSAELICFPPGSFYSSVIANLLPSGVGRAILANPCPKVYIPNCSPDPEQTGKTLEQLVATLIDTLCADLDVSRNDCPNEHLLNIVLLDSQRGDYPGGVSVPALERMGLTVIDTRLISEQSAPYYDNELLVTALLSLV